MPTRFFDHGSAIPAPQDASVNVARDLPLVESNKLRRVLLRSELLKKAKILEGFAYATPERNRLIGTPGHEATIAYIESIIKSYPSYYTMYKQPFEMPLGTGANLTNNDVEMEAFAVGIAPAGDVTGQLVYVPNLGCETKDFAAVTKGSIILVGRGVCKSAIKDALGSTAGAVGMLVYNNVEGNLDGYSLQKITTSEGAYVPAGGISKADGEALVARVQAGETIVAHISTTTKVTTTYNVVAETIGGDHDNVIFMSGHSDSVAAGPGVNDNGSGTISLLEVAIQLTAFSVNNAVRFAWWSAEEEGLLGAEYYVTEAPQTELDKIRLMLDFDMMASPNYAYQVYDGDGSAFGESGPAGSGEAEHEFERYFVQDAGLNFTTIEFDGRSDYGPFLAAGVATGGIACGAEGIKTVEEAAMFGGQAGVAYDVCYHSACDNASNVNVGAWIQMTKAIAHMTATFARSFDLLPPKSEQVKAKRMAYAKKMSDKATGALWGV
ncbi:putative leucine aminopeptidase 2 [Amylocarpus encephaloides]|uniref:Peptide hydrolase n=1 Tax=Amylocarpus encephaloides TaxID=45428 RepID=A0A9P8C5R9_9HELO|nr:putative leucine aminopeptidase 2 [Amylocarpus encephaloides]